MLDPQLQANAWIKKMESVNNLEIIKPNMDAKKLSRKLENAVSNGIPVLLEDARETFDPLLEPIISK